MVYVYMDDDDCDDDDDDDVSTYVSILDKDGKTTPDASQVGIGPLPFGSGRFDNEYR